jgi:hypothetical protein
MGPTRFAPDTDTRRPETLPYTDPFVPSTAPWKRLAAFDKVDTDYSLAVTDPSLRPVALHGQAAEPYEDRFFGNLVVELRANQVTRIPSVGPGARVVHARLGVGVDEFDLEILHDSADNWFVRSNHTGRARLVFELAIARATFGGPVGDVPPDPRVVRWGSPLPAALQRDVEVVAAHIGVPKATSRETLAALVDYFRSFAESSEPPPPARSAYLALSLSKKGVCRHRAYAFMVTASALGIRSRVVMNEAHAWVEVWDGTLWKRIDLGGAGTILDESQGEGGLDAPRYAPPPDPFRWPPGGKRGEDLGRTAFGSKTAPGRGPGPLASSGATGAVGAPRPGASSGGVSEAPVSPDGRPATSVTLEATQTSASRGQQVQVKGLVTADGLPCPRLVVTLSAVDTGAGATIPLGDLAADAAGVYAGSVVIPRSVETGDYDLVATTPGDARCGPGVSQ